MNDLTISEIQHLRRKLELDIFSLLETFKDATGLQPESIELDIINTSEISQQFNNRRRLHDVRVEITI